MIRVLLAEDLHMLRRALVSLLSLEDDIEVVAELSNGSDVVARARECRPDVAVLDIDLPGMDGISVASTLYTALPECRTLILTGLGQPGHLRRAVAAHAYGFLPKDAELERLTAAIRAVARGERAFDAALALAALDSEPGTLTSREIEVLRLAAQGEEAAQIARKLHLATGTVRNYLTTAVTKLGARNRVDAIRIARESGWL
ncbi:MerR family transcriptional regulator [Streptomyces sp. PBH53]|uniref:response regulator transcription factor n=1 Tax=Streptomyces TaxID=1883 RepID=UPI000655C12C|nr:response regulator transcription factor [Streptomyces sp. PBH53]AKN74856.1 MerR family transcriptional regulator [Streptomyces sp. PBH53]